MKSLQLIILLVDLELDRAEMEETKGNNRRKKKKGKTRKNNKKRGMLWDELRGYFKNLLKTIEFQHKPIKRLTEYPSPPRGSCNHPPTRDP
ncbi:hypothetical protein RUM43_010398 [Polyplax serrata]|uniref:Uncharacterized protein n=1 Tax=Polyplax serrata TaxID=468196 RepID=A0AAN8PLC2_POLSC